MPSWNDLLDQFDEAQKHPDEWLRGTLVDMLLSVSTRRGGRNVAIYGSAFLQKPQAPPQNLQLSHEDINGFMSTIYEMDYSKGLALILHTPGGVTNAAETIVNYLRSKFSDFEVIIPAFAMSAGTMISLGADRIIMGRQSQLGPIDPQMPVPAAGRTMSARAIVDQFEEAKRQIAEDTTAAHAWAPILATLGYGMLREAENALNYGERMVAEWLTRYMFAGAPNAEADAKAAANHFNDAQLHMSHGRRIDRNEARQFKVEVEDLEDDQNLQECVLSAYHLATIIFERTAVTRFIATSHGRQWVKSWAPADG